MSVPARVSLLGMILVACHGCGGDAINEFEPREIAHSAPAKPAPSVEPAQPKSDLVAIGPRPAPSPSRAVEPAKPAPAVVKTTYTSADPATLAAALTLPARPAENAKDSSENSYLWMPADASLIKDAPFSVKVPLGLQPILGSTPLHNPMTVGKVELGKQLYFDPRVSKDGTVSCATCHNPEKGWTDQAPVSTGINGLKGGRSAPTVLNTVYGRLMFWDGRAPSLEAQAQGPVQNPIEMGDQTHKQIIERLRTIPGYQEQFRKVFGTDVTLDGMAKAVAAFERTALSGNSAFDRYDRGDDEPSLKLLTDSQKRGLVLFGLSLRPDDEFNPGVVKRKAGCVSCHAGANFSDEQFHNLGVGWNEKERKFADLGRWSAVPIGAKSDADLGAFKTPTLRDITRTAPYMHDGSEKTLADVVAFYDRGGNPNASLDREMKPLKLTDSEKADLVEFMKALTGEEAKVELPKLPPGSDGQVPDPRAALTPPSAKTAMIHFHASIGL